jgi:glycosidase
MRASKRFLAALLAASSCLAIGCGGSGGGGARVLDSGAEAGAEVTAAARRATRKDGPIWPAKGISPIGLVTMNSGDTRRVSLAGATESRTLAVKSVTLHGGNPITAKIDGTAVHFTADSGREGLSVLKALIDTELGEREVVVPILVSVLPEVTFTFTPPDGRTPGSVFVAGEFNGWNSSKDALKDDGTGVYRATLAIEPGSYSYKFVVDGNWMADPGNPRQDTSGYGNSLLEVAGSKAQRFDIVPLSAAMPGAGRHGGVRAILAPGASLAAESLAVFVNNRFAGSGQVTVSPTGAIGFDFGAGFDGEAAVTVVARDMEGRMGTFVGRLATSGAPRSPRDEVIYYAFTDRFRDGDPSRNAPIADDRILPLANYQGGDWAGIREKIEDGYFTELGVTTIWIAPVNKNVQRAEKESVPPGNYFSSYHGYWPVSPTEPNEQFGSMEDLRALVDAAHERGIAVILDFVAAHVHQDHPLFKEHPEWFGTLELPDGRKNIRLFDEHPLTTWFDTFLPKLDYDKAPQAVDAMAEQAVYWLRESGADGLRQDAVKHIPTHFWQSLTVRLDEEFRKEGRLIYQVGETISGRGTINEYLGPDMMQGQFDFPLCFAIQGTLGRGSGSMADLVKASVDSQREYPAFSMMSPLLGNHDVPRFAAIADGDLPDGSNDKEVGIRNPPKVDAPSTYDKLRLAFAFLFAQPGAPMVYYGDEIAMSGAGDPDNRRPMPWEGWTRDQLRVRETVAALGKARSQSIALRRGILVPIHGDAERAVFARISPEETVLVALARSPQDRSLALTLPGWFGSPAGLEPLLEEGAAMKSLGGGRVSIDDAPYGFGMWRVRW